MLDRLVIRDLALIDNGEIAFGSGLNVITGETGAGKSLLVQSMGLLLGERADLGLVREGAKSAVVEGEFHLDSAPAGRARELLESWGLDADQETLIVRREVQAGGKSRASVNQSPVTQSALKSLGEILADLHGQHEHQSLLRPDAGVEVLDRLGGTLPLRARWREALAAWREALAGLERLESSLRTLSDRRDLMTEALREIDAARLVAGEEEGLKNDASRLAHADRLRALVSDALARISEGEQAAADLLGGAVHALEQAAALDPGLADLLPLVEDARIEATEAGRMLAHYLASLEADPQALERVEARRDLIARLTRKHRRDVAALLSWRDDLERELALGADAEGALEQARAVRDAAERTLLEAGRALTQRRRVAAAEWARRLTRELAPLGMAHAKLEIDVSEPPAGAERYGASGLDEVTLRFSANPGEAPKPLQRVASGGELSRIMLGLKAALEAQDRVDVLIFDEVDSGIGGAVAQAVGERLRRLALHRQVVCVTHLPMIAALAHRHFRVSKSVAAGRTRVRIEALEEEARIEELARMLAGDLATTTTRRQARELLHASAAGIP